MATITGQINLLKLYGAKRVAMGNVKGLFIPVSMNPAIFDAQKGAYLNVRIVDKPSEFNGKQYTHFIAADLNKTKKDELRQNGVSDEEIRSYTPILGNLKAWEPEAPSYENANLQPIDDGSDLRSATGFNEEPDDLPFTR